MKWENEGGEGKGRGGKTYIALIPLRLILISRRRALILFLLLDFLLDFLDYFVN
jgi:hypothetical protein